MELTYAMLSKTGKRKQNEDSILMYEQDGSYVFALADGLGGHGYGDYASQSVVNQAIERFWKTGTEENYLEGAFQSAQDRLMDQKRAAGVAAEMQTTMVLLQVTETYARWGHIGDSRLYYFEKDRIAARTLDHSVPQILALNGEIKDSGIRNHEDRNKVLRALGAPWEGAAYELDRPVALKGRQAFLLCTDGFWELILEKEIESTLRKSRSTAEWLQRMEAIVLKRGKNVNMDNYSAICVYIN